MPRTKPPSSKKHLHRPAFDWDEHARVINAWLSSRDTLNVGARDNEDRRFTQATITLFGWLPLAIILFWTSYILTKGIAFINEDRYPEYRVSASGTGTKPIIIAPQGDPSNISIRIGIPLGVRSVDVDHVANGNACLWSAPTDTLATNPSMSYRTMYNRTGRIIGRRTHIVVPTSNNAYSSAALYGSYEPTVWVQCRTEWLPKHQSFETYSFYVSNDDTYDSRPTKYVVVGSLTRLVSKRLPITLSAYNLNESKLLTLAGEPTAQQDERLLIPHAGAVAEWRPENGAEERDVLFIVIGALIALGAAVLIEGLRPLIELGIQTSYADALEDG